MSLERKSKNKKINLSRAWRVLTVAALDFATSAICLFAALWVRFDFSFAQIPESFRFNSIDIAPLWSLLIITVFAMLDLYNSVWRYVGMRELEHLIAAYGIVAALVFTCSVIFDKFLLPRSVYVIALMFSFICSTGMRFMYRFLTAINEGRLKKPGRSRNVMIIGAGAAGNSLIREYYSAGKINDRVVCAIDDNPAKQGLILNGVRIVGDRNDIPAMAKKYHVDKIVFAIPTASAEDKKDILTICSRTKCEIQTLPGIYQILNGEVSISMLKNIEMEDLLGREPVSVDTEGIREHLKGKRVMVTGGGGSIGSELSRQIAAAEPEELIIFDIYENNAYDLQMELKHLYPEMKLTVLIGSVRDDLRLDSVFSQYRPQIVFHAAAHKHVPLMEDSPLEAVKNNVLGTYKTALAAATHGTEKFVLISTDKAVNPTNVMGATKRMCEMVVQMMDRCSDTDFAAVRFGNVLGSNGSVIPLFRRQIAQGGPVTVTHRDMIRYFMTIPEAASLVLQACCYAHGGEIFVLDMGKPVRIDDMARHLIRLSGHEPDVDIKIVYTGLRPGEKLFEELLMDEEGLQDTQNHLIHIGMPIKMDDTKFVEGLRELEKACEEEKEDIRPLISKLVPTYRAAGGIK